MERGRKVKGEVKMRPAQPKSTGSLVGMVIMLICAIAFTVYAGGVLRENETPFVLSVFFYLIMATWIATAIYLVVRHARKLKSP
jgi:hypothetical protein